MCIGQLTEDRWIERENLQLSLQEKTPMRRTCGVAITHDCSRFTVGFRSNYGNHEWQSSRF